MTEKADLDAILRYFKTHNDVDTTRISLMGISQGDMVSALEAADINGNSYQGSIFLFQ